MKQPVQCDDGFLADVQRARSWMDQLHVWWLGQSGFLLQWQGAHLLIDPYLSDSLTRKYAHTDKPHTRMTARVTSPESLGFVDVVTSSHNHTDHLDAETLQPLLRVNPKLDLVIPEANREFVADRLGLVTDLPIGLTQGSFTTVAGFKIHAVPAAHESVEKDDEGRCKFLGYVVEAGPWTVYHSGDTVIYPGMVEILRRWRVDLALLPINGRSPERRVAGNLSAREAAQLSKDIGARMLIPCHYDMFDFNTADPADLARAAEAIGQPYRVLQNGERWSSGDLTDNDRSRKETSQ